MFVLLLRDAWSSTFTPVGEGVGRHWLYWLICQDEKHLEQRDQLVQSWNWPKGALMQYLVTVEKDQRSR
jgi:hypothetical protein